MKTFLNKHRWPLLSGIAGGIAGFIYWKTIGCTSGSCPVRSVWYWSMLWGAAMGYLLGDFAQDLIIRRGRKKQE
jgi:hypothetical protein